MRRLAAKRQAGSTSGALRQIAYKCSAGRGKGGAAARSPDGAETLRDPRGKLPALGLSDPCWQRGPGWDSPARCISIQLPPAKQPPLSCCTRCLSFPVGLGCTPMVGMPSQAELPVGCRGHPGSNRPGRVPHPHHWQPAWPKPVFNPPGRSPGAGCAGCVEPGVPSPSPAGIP